MTVRYISKIKQDRRKIKERQCRIVFNGLPRGLTVVEKRYNAGCLAESYQEAINILDNQRIGFDAQKSIVTSDSTQPVISWQYKGQMHMHAHNKQDALLLYRGIYPDATLDDITQEQRSKL